MTPRLRPLHALAWALQRGLFPNRMIRARAKESGLLFYGHVRDYLTRHVAKYGTYETGLTTWIARHLESRIAPGIVVDIGANIGWHSFHASRFPNVTAVVACEPDAQNLRLLKQGIKANEVANIKVVPWAIGAKRSRARLHRYKPSNLGRHSLLVDHGFGAQSVPVLDLDTTLSRLGLDNEPIHLLKIDVEGYELEVIRGAAKSLKRTDMIVLEFSPDLMRPAGIPVGELISRLSQAGFTPFILRRNGKTRRTDSAQLSKIKKQIDVLWCRRAARRRARSRR